MFDLKFLSFQSTKHGIENKQHTEGHTESYFPTSRSHWPFNLTDRRSHFDRGTKPELGRLVSTFCRAKAFIIG